MIEMAGFKDTTAFINEITPEVEQQIMQQASQPPQDPTAEAAKLYADIERSKAELKAQSDAAKNELDRQKMGLEAERKNLELAQRSAKDAADNRIAEAKLALQGLELQLKQEVSSQEAQSSQLDAVMKAIGSLQEIARG